METNVIYCGDNAETMRRYIVDNSVDLIYADPPFFSNRNYEIIWGDGYELRAFEDRWKGGINNYIAWMEPKLRECHRVLKATGSFYLHCDYHASHYLKVIMDRIFDESKFQNEIIWFYGPKASQKYPTFQKKHDTIFLYTKTDKFTFNQILQEYSKETLAERKTRYKFKDKKGRYRMTTRRNSKGKKYRAKVYLHKGVAITDVWRIPIINATSKERLGYPTQKPEALLERIIKASSNPMDIVLDPFCGCGTTIAVAHKLGRRWIGVDVSPTACKLMAKRMRKSGLKQTKIIGLPKTVEELKALAPFEFQNWVFQKLHGRVNPRKIGDYGIDGWVELDVPTQVKQSDNVGRNVVDNFETAIKRYGKKKGVIVAFSFTKGAYEEVARAKLLNEMNKLDIKLKTVEEILKET
jgi:DNA modification methylase